MLTDGMAVLTRRLAHSTILNRDASGRETSARLEVRYAKGCILRDRHRDSGNRRDGLFRRRAVALVTLAFGMSTRHIIGLMFAVVAVPVSVFAHGIYRGWPFGPRPG